MYSLGFEVVLGLEEGELVAVGELFVEVVLLIFVSVCLDQVFIPILPLHRNRI